MKKLSLNTVQGSASILLNANLQEVISAVGCTQEEWDIVVSDRPWFGKDRPRVTRIMESLLYGMIDTMGIPRFDLPAEYVASLIVLFVSPVNYFSACTWLGSFTAADDLCQYNGKEEPLEGFEKVKPRQIFALCCESHGSGILNNVVAGFYKKIDNQVKLGYGDVIDIDQARQKTKKKGG